MGLHVFTYDQRSFVGQKMLWGLIWQVVDVGEDVIHDRG